MKTIILTRHAKSSWKSDACSDFDRPLNKRGTGDVPVMAERVRVHETIPEIIVSSTAVRALQTAEMLIDELMLSSKQLKTTDEIYEASARSLIECIRKFPSVNNSAMLVGHNPGISSACSYLSKEAHVEMSTLAMVCLALEVDDWADIYPDCAVMQWHDYPKLHTRLK